MHIIDKNDVTGEVAASRKRLLKLADPKHTVDEENVIPNSYDGDELSNLLSDRLRKALNNKPKK